MDISPKNQSAPAHLDSARKLHSSGSLEPENSSSNPSLINCFENSKLLSGPNRFQVRPSYLYSLAALTLVKNEIKSYNFHGTVEEIS